MRWRRWWPAARATTRPSHDAVGTAEHGNDRAGRQRAGARLFRVLFQSVAGPIATVKTNGAFLGGLRLMALIETGTHALCDVVVRPFRCAEQPAGLRLL